MTAEEYIKSELLGYSVFTEPYAFRFDLQQLIRVIKYFAQMKCQEQREICNENARVKYIENDIRNGLTLTDSILNSPEPKF